MAHEIEEFKGEIKVASRIVDHLSSGIYKSPAACLKELINNAYDADALNVHVSVKPDADRIIVQDDGTGFSRDEFVAHFNRIAESRKRENSDTTTSGRPKIGRIGIGFIAANELCEELEIYSTQINSEELLHVTINFRIMRTDTAERRREGGDFAKADYVGEILPANPNDHHSTLILKEIRGEARDLLAGVAARHQPGSLYGKSPESIADALADPKLRSWTDLDSYSQTLLRIGLNVPVAYAPAWAPEAVLADGLEQFSAKANTLKLTLKYDGTNVRKPIVLRPGDKRTLTRTFEHRGDRVAARGYFYAQHGRIQPEELQGVLVRIRHAAVGEYDKTYWGFPASEGPLFKTWVTGEVWAGDGLEDAMNIDRSTLRDVHPAYVELRQALHEFLSLFLKDVRRELYGAGATERRVSRAKGEMRQIERVVADRTAVAPQAMEEVMETWQDEAGRDTGPVKLTRKYSVSQLYDIVIGVAEEVLPKPVLARFLKRLTDRLRK